MKPKGQSKIPLTKVMSDDCAVNVGQVITDGEITDEGTQYFIHSGEWVEVMPVMTVREVMNLSALQRASEDAGGLSDNLSKLCEELSRRVVSWNWTDMMGEPLEQPYQRADVLEGLSSEELLWLVSASGAGESEEQRKKD
jgi:hypothetical protein